MSVPESFIAGDTVEWSENLSDYPASDGWALVYSFKGPSSFSVTGAANGDAFDFTLAAATSAPLAAGLYAYQAHATKTTERFTVASGKIEVKQNLATAASGYDARGHARKTLDAIEAAIENYAASPAASITIGGRTIIRPSLPQLVMFRNQYKFMVRQEEAAERLAKGLDSGRKILTRFQ